MPRTRNKNTAECDDISEDESQETRQNDTIGCSPTKWMFFLNGSVRHSRTVNVEEGTCQKAVSAQNELEPLINDLYFLHL